MDEIQLRYGRKRYAFRLTRRDYEALATEPLNQLAFAGLIGRSAGCGGCCVSWTDLLAALHGTLEVVELETLAGSLRRLLSAATDVDEEQVRLIAISDAATVRQLLEQIVDCDAADKTQIESLEDAIWETPDCYTELERIFNEEDLDGLHDVADAILDQMDDAGFEEKPVLRRAVASWGDLNWHFMGACENGDLELAKDLLLDGANPNALDVEIELAAIHRAVVDCDMPVLEFLISNGADVNLLDGSGMSSLQHAVWNGQQEIVNRLLGWGADPNAGEQTTAQMIKKFKIEGFDGLRAD